MKLDHHERAKPNLAGLTSPVQRAEMKLLLAGRWPALKPLPVFKYETDDYRASTDFDKARGEWACHITFFPSNKIQELRGGLTEITMALPHGQPEVFTEDVPAVQPEQELEKDASRRLQALHEWRENYENGALYSELHKYLSESQQDEILDSIRLTLTARQLQFTPQNVAYVFDALSKAGGKLATFLEIARRKRAQQEPNAQVQEEAAALESECPVPVEAIHPTYDRRLQARITPSSRANVQLGYTTGGTVLNISEMGMAVATSDPLVVDDYLPRVRFQLPSSRQSIEVSAQIAWLAESKKGAGIRFVDLTADAHTQISNWIASEKPAPELEALMPAPVESLIPATLKGFPADPIESVFPKQNQTSSPEIAHTAPQASGVVTPEILDAGPPPLVQDLPEKVHRRPTVSGFRTQIRAAKVRSSADPIEGSPSHLYVLGIPGFQIAALVFLFVVISLTVWHLVGRVPLEKRLPGAQKLIAAVDATSPALPNRPGEMTSRTSALPPANNFATPTINPPAPQTEESRAESPPARSFDTGPADSPTGAWPPAPSSAVTSRSVESKSYVSLNPSPVHHDSAGLIARSAPPPENPQPAHPPRTVAPIRVAPRNSASRRAAPPTRAAPRWSPPSTVFVTGPGDGSKPFRLTLPEKTIAASSTFAMSSQLSVLVSPEPGPASTHKPARLQSAELVSFVWPRYPKQGDRYGPSETVKVRSTIGKLGQVQDIKFLSGSLSLFPAATSAIRQWHYKPTLLNKKPVLAQQDVTIEFCPPQYLSRVRARHPSPD